MRAPGPTIDAKSNTLGGDDLKVEARDLFNGQKRGLKRESKMCERAGDPGFECQVELEYPTEKEALSLGLPANTRIAVHKCSKASSSEGAFIPVNSVHEALKVGQTFCDCVDPKPVEVEVPEPVKRVTTVARQKCARSK